ncbi:MAG: SH3 domain-containing protein [Ignavibacteria bacterium]
MRDGPGKEYEVLTTLTKNSPVFLYSMNTDNDYYHIIDIETNTEGYVPSSNVKSIEALEKTSDNVFAPTGRVSSSYSEVIVHNSTSKTMTLKLNSTAYVFSPYETKTISLTQGTYSFVASASGVIPNYGSKYFEKGMGYNWEFYIITTRR